ncbi:hypothetical protein ACP70R_033258 [Stipagrostis hirtigluma subsp. patula]
MSKDYALIAASVATLVAISAFTLFCSHRRRQRRRAPSASQRSDAAGDDDVEQGRAGAVAGLDEAVLAGYPTVVYSSSGNEEEEEEGKDEKAAESGAGAATTPAGDTAWRCTVCLADYADGDELRRLPDCRHAFHRQCIDQWLRRRPTCPVCRASPPPAAKG